MVTRAPTAGQVAIMTSFALSCFGILLFLWLSFGGPVPLKPEGYRFTASFDEGTLLAEQADVRISGVNVGRVTSVAAGEGEARGRTAAEIEVEGRYAPIPADTRAILRQKTLLGETYVELTPGSPEAPTIPEGGRLGQAQVSPAVQLDEIFRAFDQPTREAFQIWMEQQAIGARGRGADLSATIGNLVPLAADARRLLELLEEQRPALSRLVRDTGEVFGALSERDGQLRGLVEQGGIVFGTLARRDERLREAFVALPTFLRESRATISRLSRFATDTRPLVRQLRPAAVELGPTFSEIRDLAPDLRRVGERLGPLAEASVSGLPALNRLLDDDLPPVLGRLEPVMREINPMIQFASPYRREITAFLGNAAAATNARGAGAGQPTAIHYLRTANPLSPEALATYTHRLESNRSNPYFLPSARGGGYADLERGLPVFEDRHCGGDFTASVSEEELGDLPGDLLERIRRFAFAGHSTSARIPRPPCELQGPFPPFPPGDSPTAYPHVFAEPEDGG